MDLPHNTLPTREDLVRAISPWWQGGGTAVLLVDTLRREEATLDQARTVAQTCGAVADKGYRVNEDVILRELGDLRSSILRSSGGQSDNDERHIGSPAWIRRADRMARQSWEQWFPGEPLPPPGTPDPTDPDAPSEADTRYAGLIRSQRANIARTVGQGRHQGG